MPISLTELERLSVLPAEAVDVLIAIARAVLALEAAKRKAAKTRAQLTDDTLGDDAVYQAIERDDRALFKCLDAYNTALARVCP